MKKYLIPITSLLLLIKTQAYAICPVCTVAVGAGIELSHYLGVDDSVTGLWIGAMLVSVSMWTIDWFDRKKIRFFLKRKITYIVYYLSVLIPLHYTNLLWSPINKIWGIDKLLLGIILGTIIFYATANWYLYLKEKNGGKAYFPFQKVVMPVFGLTLISLIFYYLTTYIYV